jgi:hypothetical protein
MFFLSGHLHADKTQVAHPSKTQDKMQSNHLPGQIRANMHTNYPSKHIRFFFKKVTELFFLPHIHTNVLLKAR